MTKHSIFWFFVLLFWTLPLHAEMVFDYKIFLAQEGSS